MTQAETNLQAHVPEILLTPGVCGVGLKGSKGAILKIELPQTVSSSQAVTPPIVWPAYGLPS